MNMKITLKAARVNAGFTIREVADKLGRNKNTIVIWEKEGSNISEKDFRTLCELYEIEPKHIKR